VTDSDRGIGMSTTRARVECHREKPVTIGHLSLTPDGLILPPARQTPYGGRPSPFARSLRYLEVLSIGV
jgi:hypothetical protein